MADVSQLKIGNILYDIKDQAARDHIQNVNNPHSTTKSQIGLGNVENLSSSEILNKMTSSNVTKALGYTPINNTELKALEDSVEEANNQAEVAITAANQKIDRLVDSDAYAIVNFINGIQISNASIYYEEETDTVIFS